MACPAAATRNDQCVSSPGVSSPRSQTSRGGLTSKLPPSSRLTRAPPLVGKARCPPTQVKSVRPKQILLVIQSSRRFQRSRNEQSCSSGRQLCNSSSALERGATRSLDSASISKRLQEGSP